MDYHPYSKDESRLLRWAYVGLPAIIGIIFWLALVIVGAALKS